MAVSQGPPTRTYIVRTMFAMVVEATKRSGTSPKYLPPLFMMVLSPIPYLLRFRGVLRTPFGKIRVTRQESMRCFVYGMFKTRFWYLRRLDQLTGGKRFFPVVVDVGACLGDLTLAMSSVSGKVLALEPGTQNFATLRSNIAVNSMDNVVARNVAAHDRTEEVSLSGNSSDLRVNSGSLGQRVRGEPLDSLVQAEGIESIDVLKIDVQGHEKSVLKGMEGMLKRHQVKLIIIEVHPNLKVPVQEVTSLIKSHGYKLLAKDDYFWDQVHFYFGDSVDQC
jgi:FkbM family methyltransferase